MTGPQRLLGVVMDPIESICPAKDSTLAMLLAAQRLGWKLIYLRQSDLFVRNGLAFGQGLAIQVTDDDICWYTSEEPWAGALDELTVLLMRKDPPFDMEYIYTTYILELAENRRLMVVNKPSS